MPYQEKIMKLMQKPAGHIVLILAVGFLAYSNTFGVPFFLDSHFITEHPFVKDIRFPSELLKKTHPDFYANLMHRYVAFLTFALNYRLHGFEVFGYHAVNISLHLLNSLLLYGLIAFTFRTPVMFRSMLTEKRLHIALLTSLIFVTHPVHTEAVNWIWQRVAVLAAFFYLASLVAYIRARLEDSKAWKRRAFYVLSLISAVLAMKTKQNAFTLPLLMAIYEFIFFHGRVKARLLRLMPFVLTLAIIPFTYLFVMGFSSEQAVRGIDSVFAVEIPHRDYLVTQFRVIVTYIRMFFVPANLPAYYAYPLYRSFFDVPVVFSAVLLTALFCSGLFLVIRYRKRKPELALTGFGIIWFFVSLVIESSLITMNITIANYRTYLPSIGLFTAVAAIAASILIRFDLRRKTVYACAFLLVIVLAFTGYARNELWKTAVSLGKDIVKSSPGDARAHLLLGMAYKQEGNPAEAQKEFEISFRLDEENTGRLGLLEKAVKPGDAESHYWLATEYLQRGEAEKALKELEATVSIDPNHAAAYYYIGFVSYLQGKYEQAVEAYKSALGAKPDFVEARTNLGGVYAQLGRYEEAISELRIVLASDPNAVEAHRFLGLVYQDTGKLNESVKELKAALKLKPDHAGAHNNLGEVYAQMGKNRDALAEFETALRLRPDFVEARRNLENIPLYPTSRKPAY